MLLKFTITIAVCTNSMLSSQRKGVRGGGGGGGGGVVVKGEHYTNPILKMVYIRVSKIIIL